MCGVGAVIERLRHAIGRRITAALPDQTGAIANALITGERGGISEETNTAFRDSGILHILSISGLHMAIMAGAVFLLVRFALAAVPAIALVHPIKKWAAAAAILGALAYLLISGASFATVRSTIMISIMLFAVILDRPALALRNVVLAATLILVLFPESLFDAGFQMSFAAVVGAGLGLRVVPPRAAAAQFVPEGSAARIVFFFFAGIVLSTLIASAAVAPFAAYHFHKSQQYAVIANLIAIPICNLVVMPAALATLIAMPLGLEALPLWVMGWGIDAMLWTARRVASLPGAVLYVPAIPTLAFLPDDRRRPVAGAVADALAIFRGGADRGRYRACADAATARPAHRRGGRARRRARGGRPLIAPSARRAHFELARWLENDGDARAPREAAKAAGFSCDGVGCRAGVKGITVAVARHPAAFSDDCRRAGILISNIVGPKTCPAAQAVVDVFTARREGAHAIYIEEDGCSAHRHGGAPARCAALVGARASGQSRLTAARRRPLSSGAAGRRGGPGCRPGRDRRCAS